MLRSRPVDVAVFRYLQLTTATIVSVRTIPGFSGLVSVHATLGSDAPVLVLATSRSSPIGDHAEMVGARIVVIEKLHPLTVGSETYTRTLLATGQPEQWVVLADDVPSGSSLY